MAIQDGRVLSRSGWHGVLLIWRVRRVGNADSYRDELMREFEALGTRKAVLGMVHLPPLPGTPFHREGSFGQIVEVAVASALALAGGGADGCLVLTVARVYHPGEDRDPTRTAAMPLVVDAIAKATGEGFQVGVQLMRNALQASLAVAAANAFGPHPHQPRYALV